jgi:hypothetical protein
VETMLISREIWQSRSRLNKQYLHPVEQAVSAACSAFYA